jgi:hypothetical protein
MVAEARPVTLLERQSALGALTSSRGEAAAGQGRVALVYGEVGIGKTALVDHFTRAGGGAARTLRGACDSLHTPRPLGPVYDIAAQAGPALRDRLDAGAPRAIFSAVLDELARAPVVINTPMHPEHPCAHCIVSSSLGAVLAAEIGAGAAPRLSSASSTADGAVRTWASVDDFTKEVALARIYDGVHYRYSTEVGSAMGKKIGELVVESLPKATRQGRSTGRAPAPAARTSGSSPWRSWAAARRPRASAP